MSVTTRVGFLAGATALTLTGVGAASTTTDATTNNLEAEVQRLTARVAELEGRNGANWLTEQRAGEIRSLVQDVLADADTRASLLQSGMSAGYDNGFNIGSSDGNFALKINGQLQTRFVYNYHSDGAGADLDDNRYGFENTRTKLWFTGHIVNPQWMYHIETGINNGDSGSWSLLDAWIGYDYGNGWKIKMGQFKTPLLREELVDSRYQLAVERSLVNSVFTGGRTQGFMAKYSQDQFRFAVSFNDGAGTANTGWDLMPTAGSTEWAFTGRGEILLSGNWDQFDEFRSAPGEETGVMVGGAIHWQNGEYGTAFPSEAETFIGTLDASAKFGGANLFGAFIYRDVDTNGGSSVDDWGAVVQGGYHFNDNWEGFLRYEYTDFDAGTEINILTVGVNHYFAGHNAKWTTDLGYSFDELAIADSRAGWRVDTSGDDGQLVIRTQLQLAF